MESKELQQHVKAFMQAHLDHPTTAQVCHAFIESLKKFQHYSQQQQEFITAVRDAFQARDIPHAKTALDNSSFIICVGDIPIFLDDVKTVPAAVEVLNGVIQQYPDMKEPIYFANPCVTSIYITIKSDKPEKVSNIIRQLVAVGVSHFRLIPSSEPNITIVQMTSSIKSSDFDEEGYYAATAMYIKLLHDENKTKIKINKAHRPYHLLDEPEESHTEIQRLYGNCFEYAGHGKIIHLPTYPMQTTHAPYIGIAFDEKEGQHLVTILDREMPITAQNYCTVNATSAELKKFTRQFRKKLKEMKLQLDICRHQCILDSEQLAELQGYIKSLKHQECYTNDPHDHVGCTCAHDASSDSD